MASRTKWANMERDFTRRVLFDTVAELYAELRPSYPEELVDDVAAFSGAAPGARVLEIGAGPGQATRLFALRGYAVTALELGANLAELARRNVADCRPVPNVLNVAFEEWQAQPESFDLAISGSAFHWIPPEVGFPKCALSLKPGGTLALFWNGDPKPQGGIHDAIQEAYRRFAPEMDRRANPSRSDERHLERIQAFEKSGLFETPTLKEYAWSRTLTAEQYSKLCCTYSDHIALPDDRREQLSLAIREAIESFGGTIVRHYLTRLYMARRLGSPSIEG